MKKYAYLLILCGITSFFGCSEETANTNTVYEVFTCDTEFKHYGISKTGKDIDDLCKQTKGTDTLAFVTANQDTEFSLDIHYSCFRTCDKPDAQRGNCGTRDFTNHASSSFQGKADITIIYTCRTIDGTTVFAPSEYQRCLNGCNAAKTACAEEL